MPETGHARPHEAEHLGGGGRRGVGGVQRDSRPLDGEARRRRQHRGGREALVDEQVDAALAGAHQRPGRAGVARVHEGEAGEVDAVAHGPAAGVHDRERGHGHAAASYTACVWLKSNSVTSIFRLSGFIAPALVVASQASACRIPSTKDRVPRRGSVPARAPDADGPVGAPHLGVAAGECDQVGGVVGVQVAEEHLVELVHRQLQARVVGERAAAEVEDEEVALGVADLDQDAGRGLGARHPGVAAAEHGHAQLAVLQLLLTGDERLGVLAPRRADDRRQGDRLVPPANVGAGRDVGSPFVISSSSCVGVTALLARSRRPGRGPLCGPRPASRRPAPHVSCRFSNFLATRGILVRLPREKVPANRHNALVAQWIEHRFPKPGVAGSIPAGGTTLMLHSALSCCGVWQHRFRIGKTADILPTRLRIMVVQTTVPSDSGRHRARVSARD